MRGTRAACLMVLGLAWMPMRLSAQDQPPDNTREYNRNPKPEPPVLWPDRPSPVKVGASVAIGFPHMTKGAVDLVIGRVFSLWLGGGHSNSTTDDVSYDLDHREIGLRIFPFRGSFFLGVAYGEQKFSARRDVDVYGTPRALRLTLESDYATPQLGWFARWDSGFVLGFDVGYQMPSGVKSQLKSEIPDFADAPFPTAEYQESVDQLEKAAKALGKKPIPVLTLLRLGWLF